MDSIASFTMATGGQSHVMWILTNQHAAW